MDLVVGELLLAAVGMDTVLSPSRVRFTIAIRNKAASTPKRLKAEARRYLAGDAFSKPVAPPEFDFDAAIDRMTDGGFNLDQTLANIGGLDDVDEALAFDHAYRKAYAYLAALAPTRMRQTLCGPRPLPPTEQERSQFRRAYAIANDPFSVLASMESGSLSPAQPRVLQALYPAIYQELIAEFQAGIVDLVAKDEAFELPWGRDKVLRTFLGNQVLNKPLAKEMQAAFAKDAAQQAGKKRGGGGGKLSGAEPTAVERIQVK